MSEGADALAGAGALTRHLNGWDALDRIPSGTFRAPGFLA